MGVRIEGQEDEDMYDEIYLPDTRVDVGAVDFGIAGE